MLERIIPGKVKAILKEVCLVDQKFVKNSDMTVAQYVESVAKEIGKPMQVVEMVRYEVGEGIEKKEENFLLTMIVSPFGRRFFRRLKGLLASLAFSSSLFVHAGIKCYNHVERNVYRLQGP